MAMLKHGVSEIENSSNMTASSIDEAHALDEREYLAARETYERKLRELERLRSLAARVLAGETGAYSEAISEFSTVGEIAHLGSSAHFTVHNPKLVECVLTVSGRQAVPTELKSLTAAGKLSVKAMPKQRFHEIYQDYVCGCVLRLAREMLALLPIEEVLVTASVNGIDSRTGTLAELPVLSAGIARSTVERLDFERLDSSDSMENFPHRGDVIASRRGGEFLPIVPLTPADLARERPEQIDFTCALTSMRSLRSEIKSQLKPVVTEPEEVVDAEKCLSL